MGACFAPSPATTVREGGPVLYWVGEDNIHFLLVLMMGKMLKA